MRSTAKLRTKAAATERRTKARASGEADSRERLTVQISGRAIERLRNAVYWTEGITLAGLVESCILEAVDRMEKKRGASFAQRDHPLRAGRPPK
jgi:hypothetical protein